MAPESSGFSWVIVIMTYASFRVVSGGEPAAPAAVHWRHRQCREGSLAGEEASTVSALQRTQQLAPRVRAARRRRRLGRANLTFHSPVGAYEWGWPTPMSIASAGKGRLNCEWPLRHSHRRPLVGPGPRAFQRLADGEHGVVAEAAADDLQSHGQPAPRPAGGHRQHRALGE